MGRPGGSVGGERDLHFFLLADCSGSMAADGRIQALNVAVRESLPHLQQAASANPHARLLFRCIAFSSSASWHIEEPTPIASVVWSDLTARGHTCLGAALDMVTEALETARVGANLLPPAIVIVSDGRPTDDYRRALDALIESPVGGRAVRVAVAIGRDADIDVLREVQNPEVGEPLRADTPEQLPDYLRWASVAATRAASEAAPQYGLTPWASDESLVFHPGEDETS